MILSNAESLINHVRDLIKVQCILEEIRNAEFKEEKISILSEHKDNDYLQNVIVYTYNPSINYGDDVVNNIINLNETDTLDDIYSLWYMLSKLAMHNNDKAMNQEFKDYMAFFPDINDLITGIITKDLDLGIDLMSIREAFNSLGVYSIDHELSNEHKVINFFEYKHR